MVKGGYIHAVGRRKRAVARIFLKAGSGAITVNGKNYESYFGREALNRIVRQPLELTELSDKVDIKATVVGGGCAGQAGAVRLGLARALVKFKEDLRGSLKKAGFLTRDSREVERKKYGLHKARKRPQYSKR
jgi:small subunit ribosomal protein S9